MGGRAPAILALGIVPCIIPTQILNNLLRRRARGRFYKCLEANRTFAEMEKRWVVWLALFLLFNAAESERVFWNDETDQQSQYTASWAVEITEGGEKMAERIALKYGFINAGKVRRDLTCKRYSHTCTVLHRKRPKTTFFNILCIYSGIVHGSGRSFISNYPQTLGNNWIHYQMVNASS